MDNRTEKRRLGDIGENIACGFLEKRGFEIIERNYLRKWGEIDIVARKSNVIHFVEVKSVSRVTLDEPVTHARPLTPERSDGGRGTSDYRPEDNMHPWKLKRLSRAIQTYLLEKNLELDWQLDLVTVKMDHQTRKARVELIDNVII
ncbi:MAG: YraN family protein [bacterium]|nr:YraN family protein [bacterium]